MFYWVRIFIEELFLKLSLGDTVSKLLTVFTITLALLFVGVVLFYIIRFLLLKFLRIKKDKSLWKSELRKANFFNQLAIFLPALIIKKLIQEIFLEESSAFLFLTALINIYIIINCTLILLNFLKALTEVMLQREGTKDKPMKSYLQIVSVIIWLISIILMISIIINKSPAGLLAGLGAFSAVLLLVFQDIITGFVYSIQISKNDIIRNGDWITMEKFGVSGTVEEVNLISAKVRNFDNTIATVPVKQLVVDSVQNWRGMQETGMRRIKRAIQIDITTIKQCSPQMLEKFKQISLIKSYIEQKEKELAAHNKDEEAIMLHGPNGRHLTNIGVLRIYIQEYLINNPRVRSDATLMVRQLDPNEYGLPLEIYCFAATTDWVEYENIQSDIFDHILSVVNFFEIRAFQRDAGKK
ncbi:MAG TPA: mechanosensitive ion channel [Bacteroidales bacterium]|jgi:miniconductance mechanosensitive channel|nr:mechanosensitive ion channel [Bacteroidales bacterium]HOS57460.1 mechanosensitive ion channel [Bacteroidales bacterium]